MSHTSATPAVRRLGPHLGRYVIQILKCWPNLLPSGFCEQWRVSQWRQTTKHVGREHIPYTLYDYLYGDGRCMKFIGFNPSMTSNKISRQAALLRPHIHCQKLFFSGRRSGHRCQVTQKKYGRPSLEPSRYATRSSGV